MAPLAFASVTQRPAQVRTTNRRRLWTGSIVLSAILMVAVGAWMFDRPPDHGAPTVQIDDIARRLSSEQLGLPPALTPAWQAADADEHVSWDALAVRIGARQAELEVLAKLRQSQTMLAYYGRDSTALAIVARSSDQAAVLAGDLARDVERIRDGEAAADWYREVVRRAQQRDFLHHAARDARASLPQFRPQLVVLGYWLQCARIAALRGDRAFFESAESESMVAAAPELPRLRADSRAALASVQAALSPGALEDLATVERALTSALTALAR